MIERLLKRERFKAPCWCGCPVGAQAPLAVQQKANCIVGRDYPMPIVDHASALKRNMERMKAAYARKEYGNPRAAQPSAGRPQPPLFLVGGVDAASDVAAPAASADKTRKRSVDCEASRARHLNRVLACAVQVHIRAAFPDARHAT